MGLIFLTVGDSVPGHLWLVCFLFYLWGDKSCALPQNWHGLKTGTAVNKVFLCPGKHIANISKAAVCSWLTIELEDIPEH